MFRFRLHSMEGSRVHCPCRMTIVTCAWMEQQWMNTLTPVEKASIQAVRFMDDILMVYAANPMWESDDLIRRFTKSECYKEPLTLTDAKDSTFLETTFSITDNKFRYWLKNENSVVQPHTIWRYQHFASATAFQQKRAVIMACMKKIQLLTSDQSALYSSATQKLAEFARLQYPISVLRGACTYMAATTAEYAWIRVRSELDTWK